MPDISPIEEIKSRLDIVDVISQYIKLRKAGANYSAICPFHAEKSGSFFVSPAKQIWRCFGCQKGGDIFTFVKEIESVEFGDALRILAVRAGVELKRQASSPAYDELKTERQRLYEANELATRFFEKQLQAGAVGRQVREYLAARGLSKEIADSWRIGWAPDSWQGLCDFLASEGFTNSELIAAGLAIARNGGGVYDRFRGRIMFPILDFNSQAVGFGGRIFGEKAKPVSAPGVSEIKEAKYLNTPSTLLYDKSRVLYGLDRAKIAIRQKNACVLVEGYTDVIMSVSAGVDNVVSSSGTALTPYQLKILKRFTDNLILGYDMDLAGDTANSRGIELATAVGFNVSVARPAYEDKDPADVIMADPQAWVGAVKSAKTIMEFYFDRAFAGKDTDTPKIKKQIAALLLPQIKRVSNAIEQSFWLQRLAKDLAVREEDLREEMKKVKLNECPAVDEPRPAAVRKTRPQMIEERLLVLAIKFPGLAVSVRGPAQKIFSDIGRLILEKIAADPDFSGAGLNEEEKQYYQMLFMGAQIEPADIKVAADEVRFHISEIEKIILKDSLGQISGNLLKAETQGDDAAAQALREKFNLLSKTAAPDIPSKK